MNSSSLYTPKYWTTWIGVGLFWLIHWLPRSLRHRLGWAIGGLAWRANAKRRHVVETNLRLCFPQWSEEKRIDIGRQHFRIMGQSLIDSSVLWFGSEKRLFKLFEMDGWKHYEAMRAEGKNVIFHAAHSAGLEFGSMAISKLEPGHGIYNPLKNPVVNHYVVRARCRLGSTLSRRQDGIRPLIRVLKKGILLYMIADEDYGSEQSVFANFFAEPKATLSTTGRIAKMTNAAVLPFTAIYDAQKKKYVARILPALKDFPREDSVQDAAALNHALEELVMLAPEQYLWTLKLFRTRLDGKSVY